MKAFLATGREKNKVTAALCTMNTCETILGLPVLLPQSVAVNSEKLTNGETNKPYTHIINRKVNQKQYTRRYVALV